MGTKWKVQIFKKEKNLDFQKLKKNIQFLLDHDEKELSTWNKNSIISNFNNNLNNHPIVISKNFKNIVSKAMLINKKTLGALDITIGSLINIWGFNTINKPFKFPSFKKIKVALSKTGIKHIFLIKNQNKQYLYKNLKNLEINLSTLGEGFAVDHISNLLDKKKINDYIVSVGGAIKSKKKCLHKNFSIIAIQNPINKKKIVHLLIKLKNQSISTSGNYRNFYYFNGKKISHLINPFTGIPIMNNLTSVTVISKSALNADAWDTALEILGFQKARKLVLKEKLAVCLIQKRKKNFYTWLSPKFKKFLIKSSINVNQ
ncbi:FAD:protein FMN transferase [Buchnera aphidicola (Mindarus keteleerifoliae)]|uniref:FAD:protein FMN transferase n=1 Tax=Buchnera aphidicola TaxID=9 RepID=UPI0031B6D0A0